MKEVTVTRQIKTYLADPGDPPLSSPEMVVRAILPTMPVHSEAMVLLILSSTNAQVECHTIASGTVNSVSIDPVVLYNRVLVSGLKKFIIVHNHPSCDLSPSEEDLMFTRKVVKGCTLLGISLLDHLIIDCTGKFMSMRKEGLIT